MALNADTYCNSDKVDLTIYTSPCNLKDNSDLMVETPLRCDKTCEYGPSGVVSGPSAVIDKSGLSMDIERIARVHDGCTGQGNRPETGNTASTIQVKPADLQLTASGESTGQTGMLAESLCDNALFRSQEADAAVTQFVVHTKDEESIPSCQDSETAPILDTLYVDSEIDNTAFSNEPLLFSSERNCASCHTGLEYSHQNDSGSNKNNNVSILLNKNEKETSDQTILQATDIDGKCLKDSNLDKNYINSVKCDPFSSDTKGDTNNEQLIKCNAGESRNTTFLKASHELNKVGYLADKSSIVDMASPPSSPTAENDRLAQSVGDRQREPIEAEATAGMQVAERQCGNNECELYGEQQGQSVNLEGINEDPEHLQITAAQHNAHNSHDLSNQQQKNTHGKTLVDSNEKSATKLEPKECLLDFSADSFGSDLDHVPITNHESRLDKPVSDSTRDNKCDPIDIVASPSDTLVSSQIENRNKYEFTETDEHVKDQFTDGKYVDDDEHCESIEGDDEHRESLKDDDEHRESIEDDDEHRESIEDNDEHRESIEDDDEHHDSIDDDDEHHESIEDDDEHRESDDEHHESIEDDDEHHGSIEDDDLHHESIEDDDEHRESIEDDGEHRESIEDDDELRESIEDDYEHRESIEDDDENRESIDDDDEHRESIEDDDEHRESIEDDDEHRESIEDDDEHRESIEDDDEHRESIEDDDEHRESIEDDDEHRESIEDDDEHRESIEDDDEHRESLEDDDDLRESIEDDDENRESIDDDDEHRESIEDDDEHRESIEDDDEHRESIEDDDEHRESIEDDDEHRESLEDDDDLRESIEDDDEHRENIEDDDEHRESIEDDDEHRESIEDVDEHRESIEDDDHADIHGGVNNYDDEERCDNIDVELSEFMEIEKEFSKNVNSDGDGFNKVEDNDKFVEKINDTDSVDGDTDLSEDVDNDKLSESSLSESVDCMGLRNSSENNKAKGYRPGNSKDSLDDSSNLRYISNVVNKEDDKSISDSICDEDSVGSEDADGYTASSENDDVEEADSSQDLFSLDKAKHMNIVNTGEKRTSIIYDDSTSEDYTDESDDTEESSDSNYSVDKLSSTAISSRPEKQSDLSGVILDMGDGTCTSQVQVPMRSDKCVTAGGFSDGSSQCPERQDAAVDASFQVVFSDEEDYIYHYTSTSEEGTPERDLRGKSDGRTHKTDGGEVKESTDHTQNTGNTFNSNHVITSHNESQFAVQTAPQCCPNVSDAVPVLRQCLVNVTGKSDSRNVVMHGEGVEQTHVTENNRIPDSQELVSQVNRRDGKCLAAVVGVAKTRTLAITTNNKQEETEQGEKTDACGRQQSLEASSDGMQQWPERPVNNESNPPHQPPDYTQTMQQHAQHSEQHAQHSEQQQHDNKYTQQHSHQEQHDNKDSQQHSQQQQHDIKQHLKQQQQGIDSAADLVTSHGGQVTESIAVTEQLNQTLVRVGNEHTSSTTSGWSECRPSGCNIPDSEIPVHLPALDPGLDPGQDPGQSDHIKRWHDQATVYTQHNASEHQTPDQCCFDVGPASATLARHRNNIGSPACLDDGECLDSNSGLDIINGLTVRYEPDILAQHTTSDCLHQPRDLAQSSGSSDVSAAADCEKLHELRLERCAGCAVSLAAQSDAENSGVSSAKEVAIRPIEEQTPRKLGNNCSTSSIVPAADMGQEGSKANEGESSSPEAAVAWTAKKNSKSKKTGGAVTSGPTGSDKTQPNVGLSKGQLPCSHVSEQAVATPLAAHTEALKAASGCPAGQITQSMVGSDRSKRKNKDTRSPGFDTASKVSNSIKSDSTNLTLTMEKTKYADNLKPNQAEEDAHVSATDKTANIIDNTSFNKDNKYIDNKTSITGDDVADDSEACGDHVHIDAVTEPKQIQVDRLSDANTTQCHIDNVCKENTANIVNIQANTATLTTEVSATGQSPALQSDKPESCKLHEVTKETYSVESTCPSSRIASKADQITDVDEENVNMYETSDNKSNHAIYYTDSDQVSAVNAAGAGADADGCSLDVPPQNSGGKLAWSDIEGPAGQDMPHPPGLITPEVAPVQPAVCPHTTLDIKPDTPRCNTPQADIAHNSKQLDTEESGQPVKISENNLLLSKEKPCDLTELSVTAGELPSVCNNTVSVPHVHSGDISDPADHGVDVDQTSSILGSSNYLQQPKMEEPRVDSEVDMNGEHGDLVADIKTDASTVSAPHAMDLPLATHVKPASVADDFTEDSDAGMTLPRCDPSALLSPDSGIDEMTDTAQSEVSELDELATPSDPPLDFALQSLQNVSDSNKCDLIPHDGLVDASEILVPPISGSLSASETDESRHDGHEELYVEGEVVECDDMGQPRCGESMAKDQAPVPEHLAVTAAIPNEILAPPEAFGMENIDHFTGAGETKYIHTPTSEQSGIEFPLTVSEVRMGGYGNAETDNENTIPSPDVYSKSVVPGDVDSKDQTIQASTDDMTDSGVHIADSPVGTDPGFAPVVISVRPVQEILGVGEGVTDTDMTKTMIHPSEQVNTSDVILEKCDSLLRLRNDSDGGASTGLLDNLVYRCEGVQCIDRVEKGVFSAHDEQIFEEGYDGGVSDEDEGDDVLYDEHCHKNKLGHSGKIMGRCDENINSYNNSGTYSQNVEQNSVGGSLAVSNNKELVKDALGNLDNGDVNREEIGENYDLTEDDLRLIAEIMSMEPSNEAEVDIREYHETYDSPDLLITTDTVPCKLLSDMPLRHNLDDQREDSYETCSGKSTEVDVENVETCERFSGDARWFGHSGRVTGATCSEETWISEPGQIEGDGPGSTATQPNTREELLVLAAMLEAENSLLRLQQQSDQHVVSYYRP